MEIKESLEERFNAKVDVVSLTAIMRSLFRNHIDLQYIQLIQIQIVTICLYKILKVPGTLIRDFKTSLTVHHYETIVYQIFIFCAIIAPVASVPDRVWNFLVLHRRCLSSLKDYS